MKKIMQRLCLEFLVLVLLLPLACVMPVSADATGAPPVQTMGYEDEFLGDEMNEHIVLNDAVYSDGAVFGNASSTYEKFRVYYNRDKTPVTGNVVTEFTVKQEGMVNGDSIHMHYYSGVSGESGETLDLRWFQIDSKGYLRANGGSDTTSVRDFAHQENRNEMKVRVQYNTVSGAMSLWIDDALVASENAGFVKTAHKHMGYLKFSTAAANVKICLEDFKWYHTPADKVPTVLETVYFENFETDVAAPASNEKITLASNDTTYKWENGALNINTTGNWIPTKFHLSPEKLTGEYVVDVMLGATSITGGGYRLNFGAGDILYVDWRGANGVFVRTWNPGSTYLLNGSNAETYSTANVLKVTMHYNETAGKVAIYLNDIYATTIEFIDKSNASIQDLIIYGYPGTLSVESIHCYRAVPIPLTDEERVAEAYEKLTENQIFSAPLTESGYLVDDLMLPTEGAADTTISWSTNVEGVIDTEKGYVTRGEAESDVKLTATISYGSGSPVTKDFFFKVPAHGVSVDHIPPQTNVVTREEFGSLNEKTIIFRETSPSSDARVENGKLVIEATTAAAGTTGAYVYLTEDHTEIKGSFGIEFTMTRDRYGNHLMVWPGHDADQRLTDIRWFDESIHFYVYDEETDSLESITFNTADFGAESTLKVTLWIDSDTGLATVLFNNRLALENAKIKPGAISKIFFLKEATKVKVYVDDLKYYQCITDDTRAARYDAEELKYDNIFGKKEIIEGVIAYDVDLPKKGNRDSVITWWSSHPEIIDPETGAVTRPAEDTLVTMKAYVTAGEVTETRSFSVTVLRSGEGDLVILGEDYKSVTQESIVNEQAIGGLLTKDLTLYTEAPLGSKVTWSSSNWELIHPETGKVTRPVDESGDIYAILTASIQNGDYTFEKNFRFGVVPASYPIDNLPVPEEKELVYESDFRKHIPEVDGDGDWNDPDNIDYNVDPWASTRGWNGRITEFDGYVQIERYTNNVVANQGTDTYMKYPVRPSKESIGGIAATKFRLEKEGTGEANIQIEGANGLAVNTFWGADGTFMIKYSDSEGSPYSIFSKPYADSAEIVVMTEEASGTFSMWINGEHVVHRGNPYSVGSTGLQSVQILLSGNNFITCRISNIRSFTTFPAMHLRPETDAAWLTEERVRNFIPAPAPGKLAANLNLATEGPLGTTITWESSNEERITLDGMVNRPEDIDEEIPVTVTATVSYGIFSVVKEFTFNVMPYYTADENVVDKDEAYLTLENYDVFSFTDADPSLVTTSLSLPDQGPYGSQYLWKTTNSSVITSSGRVIRPRWDGNPETVTLTAVIIYNTAVRTKEFTFTVLPDEEILDPKHMSDEDFFGVWDGSSWTNPGKFNYAENPEMAMVEQAAKAGDYEGAKVALLSYMRSRGNSTLMEMPKRSPGYVENFTLTGVHHNEYPTHNQGKVVIRSHDYQEYEIHTGISGLVKGSVMSYKIGARFNEDTAARILSNEYYDSSKRPRLVMTVNGSTKVFYPAGDTVIRGGSNRYNNYADEVEMEARFFGELQGEKTAEPLLQFDLSSISERDSVSDVKLYFHAKLEEGHAEEKELLIYKEGSEWSADTVTMNSFVEYVFNFNGIPGRNDWYKKANAEAEYQQQTTRLTNQGAAIAEYVYTGDEKYAYAFIWDVMDFIRDTQGRFKFTEQVGNIYGGSADWGVLPDTVRYGAFCSALSMSLKLKSLIAKFDLFATSRYMTPDVCTAILKNLWHGSYELEDFLTDPVNEGKGGNQKFYEATAITYTTLFMPEFSNADQQFTTSIDIIEDLVRWSYFDDGGYIESTDGYSGQTYNMVLDIWEKILASGRDFNDDIKTLIGKMAIYNCILKAPGGIQVAWGDSGKTYGSLSPQYPKYYKLTQDEVYQFVSTYGRKGIVPDWTSKLYESTMLAIMRSDWSDSARWAMMTSSGFAGHGHADANSMMVNGFGKSLLIDGGYYNYDATSPIRKYMISTKAHNTVEVNNTSQKQIKTNESTVGLSANATKHRWVSNGKYDYYSVTSHANLDVDHRRTVTFVKPDFWIVSDLMIPEDMERPNNYRQLWHMAPDANLGHNDENRTIYSNFDRGAEIMIASADTDARIVEDIGYDTVGWGLAAEAKYGYYFKEEVAGKQTFDTVLMPYENSGKVKADRIELGVPTHDATAMKIETEIAGRKNLTYYMLDYDHVPGAEHTFGDYVTDAELAVVRVAEDGEILEVILNQGSYVKKTNGSILLSVNEPIEALSFEKTGRTVEIEASQEVILEQVTPSAQDVDNVKYNGRLVKFEQHDGLLTLIDEDTDEILTNDSSSDKGGITGTVNGKDNESESDTVGGSEGAGGIGGDVIVPTKGFSDVAGHWAEASIDRMADKGIVKGDNGLFRPDASITRAELITMVARALNLIAEGTDTGFSDVAMDSWYGYYVMAALENGIISADSVFRPDDLVTREEMAKILSGANALLKGEAFQAPEGDLSFTDNSAISDWAKTYVLYANQNGLMNGMEDGAFAPKANGTRAQVATVLDRMFA